MDRKLRFISPVERALHLRKLDSLRDLAPADLGAIALHVQEHSFARGEALFRPGRRVGCFHIVIEGRVRVRGGEHGDVELAAGDVLGLLSLLARTDDGLDAVAAADTLTLAMDADDLFDLFEDHFAILHNQIRALAAATLRERKQIPHGTYLAPAEGLEAPATGDLNLAERLLFMRRRVFKHANMEALIGLARRLTVARLAAGDTLWEAGAAAGFLYALLSGRVRCELDDGSHFLCGPGYPLGNLESQCGAPRWYRAVAETDVVANRSETDAFLDTLEHHFDMAQDFIAAMAQGLIARLAEKRAAAADESGAAA